MSLVSDMLDADRCRRILGSAFPHLDVRDLHYFARGWDYEVWEANGGLLFRFPMREACVEPLRKDVRLLAELAEALSVPVPLPEYASEGCPAFALPFYGYRKLPGAPLNASALTDEQRLDVARQLGRFVSEVHRFPTDRAAALGVPRFSAAEWREHYRAFSERGEREVSPLLSSKARTAVREFWQSFLADDSYFQFSPVLLHGDLDDAHVLVNGANGKITGVIDFGDAMVGDPAFDFSGFEGAFRSTLLENYELQIDATLERRVDIYRRRISPYHAVFYGLEIGDREWVRRGLDALVEGIRGGE